MHHDAISKTIDARLQPAVRARDTSQKRQRIPIEDAETPSADGASRKTKALPKPNRTLVAAHHEIKLHRPESPLRARSSECAHIARATPRPVAATRRHISAVRHMRSPTPLVRPQIISAENRSIFLSHKHLMPIREPISQSILPTHLSRKGIRVPSPDHRLQNQPDGIPIGSLSATNRQHLSILAPQNQTDASPPVPASVPAESHSAAHPSPAQPYPSSHTPAP